MKIWIDADACPRAARDLVVRFALKRSLEVVLVAGQPQQKPNFSCVSLVVVPSGPDAADDHIVEQALPGDLVICSDIPLADRLLKQEWLHWTRAATNLPKKTWATAWQPGTCLPGCAMLAS